MYGMINISIREMITESHGFETWNKIKTLSGSQAEEFVSMSTYPDAITYQLVSSATQVLNISANELLENIGEYWIIHTANQGYGAILDMAGNNMVDFLKNLNTMHRGVANTMPEMVIPIFEVTDETKGSIVLNYHSKRKGLEPMVLGLIKGLGKRYDMPCRVEMIETEKTGHTFQKYKITW